MHWRAHRKETVGGRLGKEIVGHLNMQPHWQRWHLLHDTLCKGSPEAYTSRTPVLGARVALLMCLPSSQVHAHGYF